MAAQRTIPGHLKKAVTTAGTELPLTSATLYVRCFTIQALSTNTGNIFVGINGVSASDYGCYLSAGNSISFEAPASGQQQDDLNLADFYIDSAVNGEGVAVIYLKRG